MKVVVAIDSLKGSLSSLEAGEAIKSGVLNAIPDAEVCVRPLADGGEGTVEALALGMGGELKTVEVTGPLGEKVNCLYGILEESNTAILEMSGAAGITLVADEMRNPLHTTTYGVGEVIKDAIANGCRHFIVGIGGSATNDGGIGMLQALGYGMLDKDGNQVPFGAKGIKEIVTITDDQVIPELKECSFRIACDVTNPLCGERGCSAVYGPQKGATPEMVKDMDAWLSDYAKLVAEKYEKADAEYPGTGAAGGMGFACVSFLSGNLKSGIDTVLDEADFDTLKENADIIITGEGKMDSQSLMGKVPFGVAKRAKGKKVIAVVGVLDAPMDKVKEKGISEVYETNSSHLPFEKIKMKAKQQLVQTIKYIKL